jgi:hypothetical protein
MSAAWTDPCPHDGPAHDFEPLRDQKIFYVGNAAKFAICRKCGVAR